MSTLMIRKKYFHQKKQIYYFLTELIKTKIHGFFALNLNNESISKETFLTRCGEW